MPSAAYPPRQGGHMRQVLLFPTDIDVKQLVPVEWGLCKLTERQLTMLGLDLLFQLWQYWEDRAPGCAEANECHTLLGTSRLRYRIPRLPMFRDSKHFNNERRVAVYMPEYFLLGWRCPFAWAEVVETTSDDVKLRLIDGGEITEFNEFWLPIRSARIVLQHEYRVLCHNPNHRKLWITSQQTLDFDAATYLIDFDNYRLTPF